MSTVFTQRPCRILLEDTQAIVIDVQESFVPHIYEMDKIIQQIEILIQGLQALGLPIMINEQYPEGLGHTVKQISVLLNDNNQKIFEKTEFSVCDCSQSWNYLAKQNRNNVIICGIEAHVCVEQTVLDLLDNGMQPVLIANAIGSRNAYDKDISIQRMRQVGAVVTTVEGILFELCRTSKNQAFKTISQLVN